MPPTHTFIPVYNLGGSPTKLRKFSSL
jgi:hypothetical protein